MLRILALLLGLLIFGAQVVEAFLLENSERLVFLFVGAAVGLPFLTWLMNKISHALTPEAKGGGILLMGEKLDSARGFRFIRRGKKVVALVEQNGTFRRESVVKLLYQGNWIQGKVVDLRIPTSQASMKRILVDCGDECHWREPDHLELLSTNI